MLDILKIKKITEGVLAWIDNDINTSPKEEQFLYQLLGDDRDGDYVFYDQAVSIFSRKIGNPRKIKVTFEFPKDASKLPVLVIREPSRTPDNNTIGKQVGMSSFGNAIMYDSHDFHYDVMCLSENMIESILISEVLYSLYIGAYDSFWNYFNLIQFDMKELIANNDTIPMPMFIRSVGIKLQRADQIPNIIKPVLLGKVIFDYPPGLIDDEK